MINGKCAHTCRAESRICFVCGHDLAFLWVFCFCFCLFVYLFVCFLKIIGKLFFGYLLISSFCLLYVLFIHCIFSESFFFLLSFATFALLIGPKLCEPKTGKIQFQLSWRPKKRLSFHFQINVFAFGKSSDISMSTWFFLIPKIILPWKLCKAIITVF